MAEAGKITIRFEAKDDEKLIRSIKNLDAATKSLVNTQQKAVTTAKKTTTAQKKLNKNVNGGVLGFRNLRNATNKNSVAFSVFRSKLLLATFAVGLIDRAIIGLIKSYGKQQQAQLKVLATLKSTGFASRMTAKEIFELTRRLQKSGVVGDEVNLQMSSLMLTYNKIGREVFPRAIKAMNDMAVATSMGIPTTEELKSVTTMLAKALQDPVKGVNALRRVGFSLSVQQQQLVKDFMAVGDTVEAQNVILEAAELQYGGLAKVIADSVVGSMEQLSMAWGDANENMGAVLSSVILPMIGALKTFSELLTPGRVKVYAMVITGTLVVALNQYIKGLERAVIWQTRLGWGALATAAGVVAAELLIMSGIFDDAEDNIGKAKKATSEYISEFMGLNLSSTNTELERQQKILEEMQSTKIVQPEAPTVPDREIGEISFIPSGDLFNETIDIYTGALTRLVVEGEEFGKDFVAGIFPLTEAKSLGQQLVNSVTGVTQAYEDASIAQASMKVVSKESVEEQKKIIEHLKLQKAVLEAGFDSMQNFNNESEVMLDLYSKTPEAQRAAIEAQITMAQRFKDNAIALGLSAEAIEEYDAVLRMLNETLVGLNKPSKEQQDIINGLTNIWNESTEAQLAVIDAQLLALETSTDFNDAQKEYIRLQLEAQKADLAKAESLTKMEEAMLALTSTMKGVGGVMDFSAFEALDFNAESQKEALEQGVAARESFYTQLGEMSMEFAASELAKEEEKIRATGERELEQLRNSRAYKFMSDKKKLEEEKKITDATNKKLKENFNKKQTIAYSQIAIDTARAVMGIWAETPKFDFGISAAALTAMVVGMGAAQAAIVGQQKAPSFAQGGDFVVPPGFPNDSFPMNVESGERVQITPKSGVGGAAPSQATVNVSFAGNVLSQDFIEDEAIPMIKEAIRRGADIGVA